MAFKLGLEELGDRSQSLHALLALPITGTVHSAIGSIRSLRQMARMTLSSIAAGTVLAAKKDRTAGG